MFKTNFDSEQKIWSNGLVPALYNPNISIAQVILKSCEIYGSKVAQISDDSGLQLTYDEIRIKTIRAAQNLQKRGYKKREVFGFLTKNSHHLAPIVFASIAIGCPVNTLDPSFGETELLHMLKTTKPGLMFCDVEAYKLVKDCLLELKNDAKIYTFGGQDGESEPVEVLFDETHSERNFLPLEVDGENDTVAIICSSGTTGLSKGVCLSHAALLDAVMQFDTATSADVLLCFSSLYWISGLLIQLLGTLNGATRIITTHNFTANLQLSLIEKYKVTISWNAPYHLTLISKSSCLETTNLSSLKYQFVAGGKCSFQVQSEIASKLKNGKVCVCYGLSEAAGILSVSSGDTDSVGRLLGLHEIKIVNDQGGRCGIGENGEVCFKPKYKFLGYYGNQQATDEAIDDEGFFRTADVGHFDDSGDLYIVDRKKDIMKYYGAQISPSHIESYLIESPGIKAVCVIGMPDEIATDLPAAVIIRSEHYSITEHEVYDLVSNHFTDYYKLRGGVFFVDALPVTPSGKILRRKVREIAINMNSIKI